MIQNILIRGKVQGVFYRASALEAARRFEISGWVRNLPDGNVEAMVQGAQEQLSQFIEWCKIGPEGAEVIEVVVTEVQEDGNDVHPKIQIGIFEIIR